MILDTTMNRISMVSVDQWNGVWTAVMWAHFALGVVLIGAVVHGLFFKKPRNR